VIFGKSWEEKRKLDNERLKKREEGRIWFAWYPVKENNKRWVWLEKVFIDYHVYEHLGVLYDGNAKTYKLLKDVENKSEIDQ